MMNNKRIAMIFFAIVVISLTGLGAVFGASPASDDLKPVPDIKFKDLAGNKFKLSDHRGKVVIVNFWAVWCPPCKVEVPELVKLYTKYKEQGLMIIGIAIDSGKDGKVKEKAQELGINYPVINGDDSYIRKSFGGIRAVPTTFIINQEGKFYKNYVGYRDKTVFEEDIKALLPFVQQQLIAEISLIEVQRPEKASSRYGPQRIEKVAESGKSKYYFEDGMIKIFWLPGVSELSFVLENKTDYSIKVMWDEGAYVDDSGISHRIMHSGVKYVDRNNPQPPSVVAGKSTLEDMLAPTDKVFFDKKSLNSGWKSEPLFPIVTETGNSQEEIKESLIGQTFRVLLPLQIENVTNDYVFIFKINDITVQQKG